MRSSIQSRLALLGISVAGACLLAELGLWGVGFSRPNFYEPDAVLGARLRPGVQAWDRREGNAFVSINQDGLRDREHPQKAPTGTFRVAVLGDSFAEALQVDASETFWAVAERQLASCSALKSNQVEFLNFGVSGYGTAQEYLMLQTVVPAYDPDVVVLQLFARNDVRDNHRDLTPDKARPFFTLDGEQLRIDNSFRQHPRYLRRRSAFARAGYAVINQIRLLQLMNTALNEVQKPAIATKEAPTSQIADPIFAPPTSELWRDAWRVTERLIESSAMESETQHAEFVLMSVSIPDQVHPDTNHRKAFARDRAVDDLFYSERRLAQVAAQAGFNYLALGPQLQAEAEQDKLHFHGFGRTGTLGRGHWNRLGHQRAGIHLARHLCEVLTSTTPRITQVLGPLLGVHRAPAQLDTRPSAR